MLFIPTAEEWIALRLSLLTATCSACIGLIPAMALGYLLARKSFRGKWAVEVAVNLPLSLPPVVTGYLLLVLLAPSGIIGGPIQRWFDCKIVFTWQAAALASTVMSFPLAVRAVRLAFQSVDPRLELAARTLGASRIGAFFAISLPLAMRGVVAGWTLAFARSLGEFGATIMIAGNIEGETRTIPLAIYSLANRPGGMDEAWRLVALSVVLSCGALAMSEYLERRRSHDALA